MRRSARSADNASQLPLLPVTAQPERFRVRASGRARQMSIHVFAHGGVEVVVPKRARPAEIEAFVRENRSWIDAATSEIALDAPARLTVPPNEIILPAIGERVTVSYRRAPTRRIRLQARPGRLILTGAVDDHPACRRALRRWLAGRARAAFVPTLRTLTRETGLDYARVQVRGQRTRWGSCSESGTLSLNYSLLFLEPDCMRYLLLHELCHTRHMNHSRAFWRLVGRYEPRWRALDHRVGEAWSEIPGWVTVD